VNKAELVEALAGRLGDKKLATTALDAVLSEIQAAVTKGEKVAITGFGIFEKRVRGPRTARNPRTGETVKVKKTSVPTFRPGSTFKDMVASGRVPKAAAPAKKAAAKKAAPAKKAAAPAKKAAAPAKKAAAKAPAKKAAKTTRAAAKTATRATATARTAKKAAAKAPAKRGTARKA
jgi:DNA-binding protein HU-beta